MTKNEYNWVERKPKKGMVVVALQDLSRDSPITKGQRLVIRKVVSPRWVRKDKKWVTLLFEGMDDYQGWYALRFAPACRKVEKVL